MLYEISKRELHWKWDIPKIKVRVSSQSWEDLETDGETQF